jgi:small-conductance mechanosensitive channel
LVDRIIDFYRLQEDESLLLFWIKEILIALVILAAFWGVSHLVRYVLLKIVPRFTAYTRTDLDDRILRRITPPISLLVVLAGFYYAELSLPLPDGTHKILSGIFFIANIVVVTGIAFKVTGETLDWYGHRVAERTGEGPDRRVLPVVQKIAVIFLVGASLIVTLKHFNYDIFSLVTALGIGSLAIGMAAKDTLANMISGFTLMIDRPFHIGDRIQLSAGQIGDVVDIGLRSTKIQTGDNTLLIIPNSELCNSTVINMATPDVRGKGQVKVGVAYDSDVSAVKELLVGIALEHPEVLRDPAPAAFFTSFGESALNVSLFFWTDNYNKVFNATDELNTLILKRFGDAGIEIPYPTRTVSWRRDNGSQN